MTHCHTTDYLARSGKRRSYTYSITDKALEDLSAPAVSEDDIVDNVKAAAKPQKAKQPSPCNRIHQNPAVDALLKAIEDCDLRTQKLRAQRQKLARDIKTTEGEAEQLRAAIAKLA